MKHLIYLFTLSAVFVFTCNAGAQQQTSTVSLSLKQAQEYAAQNNRTIVNSKVDVEIAKKKIWETEAMGLPQISGAASYQHIWSVPIVEFPLGNGKYMEIPLALENNATYSATVSQLLFSGSYLVGLQATKVFALMNQQSLEKSQLDVKESVANSYFLALSLEEYRKTLQSNIESLEKTKNEMEKMNEQGFTENTDVDQIQLTYNAVNTGLSSMNRQIENVYNLLKLQLALPLETPLVLTDKFEEIFSQINLESVVEQKFNITNNLDYNLLLTQEKIARLNIKLDQSSFLPTLACYYMHQGLFKTPVFNTTHPDVAGATLNVPIFSSGQRNVKVQQRKMELNKVLTTKLQVEESLNLTLLSLKNDLRSTYEKYLNEKNSMELASRIYEKTLVKYKEGVSSSLDLTTAQNQYLAAQDNYFTSIYNVMQAKLKLDKIMNTL